MDTCAHAETVVKILDPRYRGSALKWRRTRKTCSVACVSRWRVPSSSVLTHTRGGNTTSQHGPNEVCSSRLMDFLDNVIVEGEGARDTSRTGQVRPRPDRCSRGLPNEPRQRCTSEGGNGGHRSGICSVRASCLGISLLGFAI